MARVRRSTSSLSTVYWTKFIVNFCFCYWSLGLLGFPGWFQRSLFSIVCRVFDSWIHQFSFYIDFLGMRFAPSSSLRYWGLAELSSWRPSALIATKNGILVSLHSGRQFFHVLCFGLFSSAVQCEKKNVAVLCVQPLPGDETCAFSFISVLSTFRVVLIPCHCIGRALGTPLLFRYFSYFWWSISWGCSFSVFLIGGSVLFFDVLRRPEARGCQLVAARLGLVAWLFVCCWLLTRLHWVVLYCSGDVEVSI